MDMYRNNDYDSDTDSEVDLYINLKYTPINTTTDSFVQKYLTGPNIQTLQPNLQLSPVVQASPPPLAIVQDLGLDLSKVLKKSHKTYNIIDNLASCKMFSDYPKDNGLKFMKEFESFANLRELVISHIWYGQDVWSFHS